MYSIIPVISGRTIPRWDPAKRLAQEERWRKISREAAKQCGRADIPIIGAISDIKEIINNSSDYDKRFIAILSDETICLKEALEGFDGGKIAIAIGPEGDFTPDEAGLAKLAGFKPVSLGPRVLKSDTAGLASLAILNYVFSN